MKTRALIAPIFASLVIAACGGSSTPEAAEPMAEAPSPEEMTDDAAETESSGFDAQAVRGQELYGAHCAECHGASGEGGDAPRLVGLDEGALPLDPPEGAKYRTSQFKTVADIASFVVTSMPPGKGGSLSDDEYWAILAFDLKANGIELDQELTPELAATLEVPR